MRKTLQLSLSLLCGFFITHINAAPPKVQSLDRIVAVVNDSPITETDLNDAISTFKKQVSATGAPLPPQDVLQKQMLQHIIDRKLQLQLAEQSGLKIDEAQVDKAIEHIAGENKATPAQLYEQLTKQGLSVAAYRKEIGEEIIIQQLQHQQVGAKITITPQEVNDFMRSKPWQASNNKEYHLEDILITLPDSPTTQQIQDAKKRAETLMEKIHQGSSFRNAAMAESSGNKALEGGDLGWRKLPEIPSAFAEQVIHMQANEIAGPIQAPNGFHIIRVAGLRDAGTKDAPTTKQVEQLIFQRKMEEAVQAWMTKTRSQSFIDMNPEA